jgi:hypothetical protein
MGDRAAEHTGGYRGQVLTLGKQAIRDRAHVVSRGRRIFSVRPGDTGNGKKQILLAVAPCATINDLRAGARVRKIDGKASDAYTQPARANEN